jgi:lipopolysaccharide cholinephosphotransferase
MYYLFIILYILIFLSIIYILNINAMLEYKEIKPECDTFDMIKISNNERSDIYSYLKILSNCLRIRNVTFWIISGTILGSVRHGEMIPWDDDADIGVFEEDIGKIIGFNKIINKFGYEIVPHWLIYKFRKIGQEYPFIDIFCYYKSDDRYIMNYEELRLKWPEEYFNEDELFPLKPYKFGSLNLPGPNYPLPYLDRMYPKWQYLGIQGYDHKKLEHVNEEIDLDQENESHKLTPYKIIKVKKNKKNPYLFMKKKYNKYHNKNILLFEQK